MNADGETRMCGSCAFFDFVMVYDEENETEEPSTICRRFPPADGWATVLADDWCGEFATTGARDV